MLDRKEARLIVNLCRKAMDCHVKIEISDETKTRLGILFFGESGQNFIRVYPSAMLQEQNLDPICLQFRALQWRPRIKLTAKPDLREQFAFTVLHEMAHVKHQHFAKLLNQFPKNYTLLNQVELKFSGSAEDFAAVYHVRVEQEDEANREAAKSMLKIIPKLKTIKGL
jgi:hypothetical protein